MRSGWDWWRVGKSGEKKRGAWKGRKIGENEKRCCGDREWKVKRMSEMGRVSDIGREGGMEREGGVGREGGAGREGGVGREISY